MAYSLVPGRGNKNAKLAVIGEAPGWEEFNEGKPFVGPSGRMLSTILGHNCIPEREIWIDNVVQTKTSGRNPSFEDIKTAIPGLRSRLRELPDLNCLVAVGGVALQALSVFEFSGITKYRGSILPARLVGKKMVPIVHPAFIMKDGNREYRYMHVSISDVGRAWEQSDFGDIRRPARRHRILYHFDEAIESIRTLQGRRWVFDLETSLPCLGFALSPWESFTIPFASITYPHIWPARQREMLIAELKTVFTKEAEIIGQNIFFDKRVLARDYGIDPKAWVCYCDTMWYHQLLYNELPHSLGFLASIYTEEPFYKDEGKTFRKGIDDEKQYFTYNGKDCCTTFEVFEGEEEEALECGQRDYFYDVIMAAEPILWAMHQDGVWVSKSDLEEVKRELNRKVCISRIKTHQMLGFEVNPRAPTEMEPALRAIGIPEKEIVRSEKTGKVKTDEDYLQRLFAKYHREEILELLRLRKSLHLISGFTNLDTDEQGRFHAVFKIGPKSGRLACSGDDRGPQLQNVPLPMRRIFAAPPGRVFVELDLEQADTRCLAYGVPEPMLIQLFESEDSDIHSQVCAEIFSIPRGEIDKHGKHSGDRKIAKEVGHGSNYGMGPRKLVTILREHGIFIPEGQARAFQTAYFDRFINIRGCYHPSVQDSIRKTRIIYDLNGRRHVFLGFLDDTTFREAYSRMPQGTIAGLMLKGMIRLQRLFDERSWKNEPLILIQVHDSLVVECDQTDDVLTAQLMYEAFSIPLSAHGREFRIPMEISVGTRWGKLCQISSNIFVSKIDTGFGLVH